MTLQDSPDQLGIGCDLLGLNDVEINNYICQYRTDYLRYGLIVYELYRLDVMDRWIYKIGQVVICKPE